jgi:hypothetical protein
VSGDQSWVLQFGLIAAAAAAAHGWFSDKSLKLKEDAFNKDLRAQLGAGKAQLEAEKTRFDAEMAAARERLRAEEQNAVREHQGREAYFAALRTNLNAGPLKGRQWLAKFVAEADRAFDDSITAHLRYKQRPALKAAEEIAAALAERRKYKERCALYEYTLLALKERYPDIEEFEEDLSEDAGVLDEETEAAPQTDPVSRFVSDAEFAALTAAERNQLALDRYLDGGLSRAQIGRLYERYIGHLFAQDGWQVEYHGIKRGLQDLGRDLVCSKGGEVKIIQAKCWSAGKVVHERHVFQLFGTSRHYTTERSMADLFAPAVTARLVTTTNLSDMARAAAALLKVEVDERRALDKTFPMIKCNVNQDTNERIYHLPFDQQYDRTIVRQQLGERMVRTVSEAESLGFRRAFRFSGLAPARSKA